jgi:hypothetical protein
MNIFPSIRDHEYNRTMLDSFHRRTLTIWLAALAILFSALAPSISHALSVNRNNVDSLAICSAYGSKQLPSYVKGENQKPVKQSQHYLAHCPYCFTHGGSVALLPPVALSFAVQAGHGLFPSLYYQAPAKLYAWSTAQPRAPPAIS